MTPLLIELMVLTAAVGVLRLARGRGARLFQRIPVVPTLLLAHAVAVALVVAFGVTGATRPGLVFAFVCLVPGAALVGLVALHDPLAETVLSLALSLTLVLLAALAAAALNAWNPSGILFVLAVLSAGLLLVQIGRPTGTPFALRGTVQRG